VTSREDLTWRQAGGAYYAETDGRIVALLYWYSKGDVHYLHGPDSESDEPPEPGWFVVMCDEPDDHRAVEGPVPMVGEQLDDLSEATRAALGRATKVVTGCLDAARRA
jgi:hypothetical protein